MFLSLIGLQAVAVLVMISLIYATINNVSGEALCTKPRPADSARQGIGDLSFKDTFAEAPKLESVTTYLSLFICAVCVSQPSLPFASF